MSADDERFMDRALELARRGRRSVEPNPMVGAVLVRDGREVACGWHGLFGGPHAEVEALRAAAQAGVDARGATMYVSLEPCSHHGKTPPCTEALIEGGVARVVAAMEDPDEQVAGRGIRRLREAGVAVTLGVRESAAKAMLGPYIKLRTRGRPWVICKWAQTPEGLLALPPSAGRWISCQASREAVHELRGRCDGILVGMGTVRTDDPLLTNRGEGGRQPTRVVLDSRLSIAADRQVVRTADRWPVLVATTEGALATNPRAAQALRDAGVEVLALPAEPGGVSVEALLDELGRRQWTHLLVEAGPGVLRRFVLDGLADELWAFVCPWNAPGGFDPQACGLPRFDLADVRTALSLAEPAERRVAGPDTLFRYVLPRPGSRDGGR